MYPHRNPSAVSPDRNRFRDLRGLIVPRKDSQLSLSLTDQISGPRRLALQYRVPPDLCGFSTP